MAIQHQYIERRTGKVCTEPLFWDRTVRLMYTELREHAPTLFRALVGPYVSRLIGCINFDLPLTRSLAQFLTSCSVSLDECIEKPEKLDTARKLFERRIRYWECRPMSDDQHTVVSPADSRVIVGSHEETSILFIKRKFFQYEELLGEEKQEWISAFRHGDFAIFRLTPDKYHYNHMPVAGVVQDFYEIPGDYHSCNPGAVVTVVTPYSKNKRFITIIDTDVPEGTRVGLVAMVEVAALMIGDVVQLYSEHLYDDPRPITKGMHVRKGAPKSLYRPGSSTDVLLFQHGRVELCDDIVSNLRRTDVCSRFSVGFGQSIVETDLKVRSPIGRAVKS